MECTTPFHPFSVWPTNSKLYYVPCSNSGCRVLWGQGVATLLYSGGCDTSLLCATAKQIDVGSLPINWHKMLSLLCLGDYWHFTVCRTCQFNPLYLHCKKHIIIFWKSSSIMCSKQKCTDRYGPCVNAILSFHKLNKVTGYGLEDWSSIPSRGSVLFLITIKHNNKCSFCIHAMFLSTKRNNVVMDFVFCRWITRYIRTFNKYWLF